MYIPEDRSAIDRILGESSLPAAPMAMPEQVLWRQRRFRLLVTRPLLAWLNAR